MNSTKKKDFYRSQLHFRAGYERIKMGKLSAGLGTLFDCLNSALRYYVLTNENLIKKYNLSSKNIKNINEIELFNIFMEEEKDIKSKTKPPMTFQFYNNFETIVNESLEGKINLDKFRKLESSFKLIIKRIGIIPLNEDKLPEIDYSIL